MSIFVVKIIACMTMVLDHVKYALPETRNFATVYFGRMAFPLFAFLLTEGFCHTSNLKKYYQRLLLFAVLSQIPFMLFRTLVGEWRMLNILFTLLLGLMAITIWAKFRGKYYICVPFVALFIFLGKCLNVDYSWYGVSCVILFYWFRNKGFFRILAFAMLNFIYYFNRFVPHASMESIISYVFTTLPAFLLLFYNGKLGHKTKYLYYIFYPLHMLILYVIRFI